MSHQKLIAAVSLIGLASIAAGGSAIAGTGTAGHITICYNAKTHVARYSGSGRCAPGVRAVVIGKGDVGARGALGPQGPHGSAGLDGNDGNDGADGTDGSNGSGGTNGNNGAQAFKDRPERPARVVRLDPPAAAGATGSTEAADHRCGAGRDRADRRRRCERRFTEWCPLRSSSTEP